MRIAATPRVASEGRQLASELLAIVSRETRRAEEETGSTATERSRAGAGQAEAAGRGDEAA